MTKKECYRCITIMKRMKEIQQIVGYIIKEWCDISKAHNRFLMSDKRCPYFRDDFNE